MKKVMMMLAAVAAVGAASAATVDWNYKVTGAAGGSATEFAGYTAYLVDAAYYTGLSKVTADSITSDGKYLQSAAVAQTGSSGKGSSKKYVFSTGAQEYKDTSLVEGDSYSYYLVLVDAAGENYFAQAYNYTARGATATPSETEITLDIPAATVSAGMTAWATPTPGPGPIPEPTSGLLLLVGGAMLALRRKQK